ncbi:hypothetical protein BGZ50_002442 [Haplosporangium sp. Z 11]|nr:hypothetical protein BGZ50_002442 [Haplosporangium sp. Z 11]
MPYTTKAVETSSLESTPPYSNEKDAEQQQKQQIQGSDQPSLSRVRLLLLSFSLFLSSFLSSLDISIIATALPRIVSDFDAQSQMSWVASIYLLAYTTLQPIYGRFADIFGRKPMYLFGCTTFFIGSIGCGATSSMMMLILFRAVQGLGGAGLFSLVFIIISDMFPDVEERARYQSVVWAAFGISSVVGPLLGGVFVEHASWRWCFYINLPLGAISSLLFLKLYQMPFERTNLRHKLGRIDYLGLVFVVATVICLLQPLTWGGTVYSWRSLVIIVLFMAFALLLVALVFVESRATEAIIPPALFLNRDITIVMLTSCLVGIVFMGSTFYLPLYFQVVGGGVSTTESGVRLMPSILGATVSIIASSFLLKGVKDFRYFIWVGLAVMALGVGLFILSDVDTPVGQQVGAVLIMGLGQGLIFQNSMLACQEAAPEKDTAVVTAFFGFFDSIGVAIGVAISAAAFNNALVKNLGKMSEEIQRIATEHKVVGNMNAVADLPSTIKIEVVKAYAEVFQFLFTVLTPILVFVFLMSLFIRRRRGSV